MSSTDLIMGSAGGGSTVKDPYLNNVSLLLNGNGTNGAQNNTFLDSSTNNFTITRNGNTTQGSFSPYGNLWSNYFNGSSSLAIGSVAASGPLDLSTATFTVECWVYVSSTGSNQDIICSSASSISSNSTVDWALRVTSGNAAAFTCVNGTTVYTVTASATFNLNSWNHVAATRSGTTCVVYVNGVGTSGTVASAFNTNLKIYMGSLGPSGINNVNGYVSNLRVVKGSTVYTGNFTPPTTPLTAISGTSLLTEQSNRFIDNSSNAYVISVSSGTPSVQRFSPFNPTAPYSTSVIGGSGYFDGTGDYLSLNNVAAPGSGNFTIEFWVYNPNQAASSGGGVDYRPLTTQGVYITLGVGTDGSVSFYTNSAQRISTTLKCQSSAWNHVALVRSSGTTKVYVNGVADAATYADSNNYLTAANRPLINGSGYFATGNGVSYVSDFRLVVGTAVYTTNFTPPTAPLTAITNTSLLLNYTNAGIPDLAMMNDLETVGNAQVSTSVKKYGTGSLAFDGTGDYLTSNPATPDLYAFGSGDFTVEFWMYLNSTSGSQVIYDGRTAAPGTTQPTIYCSSGTIYYYTNGANRITGSALSATTWYHIAICRSGTSTKMFINGTQVGSTYTDSTSYTNSSTRPYIGGDGTASANYYNGYIDDLRVTKGLARYTANFTPPTQALPNQ